MDWPQAAPNIIGNHITCTSFKNTCLAQSGLNPPESFAVLPVITVQYWLGPLGAILGQFAGPTEVLDQNIEVNLGWISPLSSAQNDLNTLK